MGIHLIDQDAAARFGVKIGRTLNAFTLPVADTVMGYILAFARRHPEMDREVKCTPTPNGGRAGARGDYD